MIQDATTVEASARPKQDRLIAWLKEHAPVAVAFSGGVDSTYLLAVAHQALGEAAVAITADGPFQPRALARRAAAFCQERGIRHVLLPGNELDDPQVAANGRDRCGHCKRHLMESILAWMAGEGRVCTVLLGAVADDRSDYRPGMKAAAAAGARFPMLDLDLSKAEVRVLSRDLGLPTWDQPASPCLASRFPYGEAITVQGLAMVEAAEDLLIAAGFRECRARHHRLGDQALLRIEVPDEHLDRLMAHRRDLLPRLIAIGYLKVAVDLAGLVSGGYNQAIGEHRRN